MSGVEFALALAALILLLEILAAALAFTRYWAGLRETERRAQDGWPQDAYLYSGRPAKLGLAKAPIQPGKGASQ